MGRITKFLLFALCIGITHNTCLAQFSPPGLGKVNTAEWFAIGLKQNLNAKKMVNSATFFGLGRSSTPYDYNPWDRAAIYVVNQEIKHRFAKNWVYAGALSYRWQNQYTAKDPYVLDSPGGRQEVRTYGKISYLLDFEKIDLSITYRPELRLFFNPDFSPHEETTQLRSRLKAKLSFILNSAKTQKIIASMEHLVSSTKTDDWSQWRYKETRFCMYFSVALPKQKVVLNIGYMNDMVGSPITNDGHYFAFDITIKNPFGK